MFIINEKYYKIIIDYIVKNYKILKRFIINFFIELKI